jgi:rusticyanin
MTLRSAVWTGVAVAAIGIGGLIFTGVAGATGLRLPWTQGQAVAGMMGAGAAGAGYGGMMGAGGAGGIMGGGVQAGTSLINNASLAALVDQGKAGASIDTKTNTVTYTGTSATIVALASPHGQPNMTWEIDGLVNPTVVVRSGTQVTVDLVNTDWGYMHGLELTTTPPPYPYMGMMAISNDFLLMPLPERTSQNLTATEYYMRSGTVSLSAGTYYYLCPVPGHAQQGMHGVFEVSA